MDFKKKRLQELLHDSPGIYQFLSKKYRDDEKIAEISFNNYLGLNLEHSSNRLKDNIVTVKHAIKTSNGFAVRFASNRLKRDREIALLIANLNPNALPDVDYNFIIDRELIKIAINKYAHVLKYTSGYYRDDEEIIKLAISQKGRAIQYASKRLQERYDIALSAVTQKGKALKYLDKFNSDEDIVLAAVKQYEGSIKYADKNLIQNPVFIKKAILINSLVIQFINDNLKLEFAQLAVDNNLLAIRCLNDKILNKITIDFTKHKSYTFTNIPCILLMDGTSIEIDEENISRVDDIIIYLQHKFSKYSNKKITILYDTQILDKSTDINIYDVTLDTILEKHPDKPTSFNFEFNCIISNYSD